MSEFVPTLTLEHALVLREHARAAKAQFEAVERADRAEITAPTFLKDLRQNWLESCPYQFDTKDHTSIATLQAITYVTALSQSTQYPDISRVDAHTLHQLGVLTKETLSPKDYTVTQLLSGTLFAICDRWKQVCRVTGLRQLLYAMEHRWAQLVTREHKVSIFDDGRYCAEKDGAAKRMADEDAAQQTKMLRHEMNICGKLDLEKDKAEYEALQEARNQRMKIPRLSMLLEPAMIFHNMYAELDLLEKHTPEVLSEERTAQVMKLCLSNARMVLVRSLNNRRFSFKCASELAPGDLERYHVNCSQLPIEPEAIMQRQRAVPAEPALDGKAQLERISDTKDPFSMLALAEKTYGKHVVFITPMHEKYGYDDPATLRFIGGELAVVYKEQAHFRGEGVSPYVLLALYLRFIGHDVEQVENSKQRQLEVEACAKEKLRKRPRIAP